MNFSSISGTAIANNEKDSATAPETRVMYIEGGYDDGLLLPLSLLPYLDSIKRVKRRAYSSTDPLIFTDVVIEPRIVKIADIKPSSDSIGATTERLKEARAKLEEEIKVIDAKLK